MHRHARLPRRHFTRSQIALILSTLPLLPHPATAATTYTWTNPAGGTWTDPANWSPNSIPAPTDSATFQLASTPGYTVTLPDPTTTISTLSIPNDTLTLTQPDTSTTHITTLNLANTPSQSASLTLTGGTFSVGSLPSAAVSSTATLTVSPNTTLRTSNLFTGSGTGTTTVHLDGPNAQLLFPLGLTLQGTTAGGPVSLSLTNGALLTDQTYTGTPVGSVSIATSGGTASATLDGTGTTLASYLVNIGDGASSSATLSARNAAQISAYQINLASAGANGTLTLDGPNTLATAQTLNAAQGTGSAATLSITNGAKLSLAYYAILPSAGGTASISVDGPGSTLDSHGNLTSGSSGSSGSGNVSVSASNGAQISAFEVEIGTGLSAHGTLSVNSGAHLTADMLHVGTSNATGTASIDGPGTTVTTTEGLLVNAPAGTTALSLTNGATLLGPLGVSYTAGARGSFLVDSGATIDTRGGSSGATNAAITLGSPTPNRSTWTSGPFDLSNSALAINAGGDLTVNGTSLDPLSSITVYPGGTFTDLGRPGGGGALRLAGGAMTLADLGDFHHSILSGFGTIHSHALPIGESTISPDGTLAFDPATSDLQPSPLTRFNFDITSPSTYDRLTSIHSMLFSGILTVSADPSYTPTPGDSFQLFSFTSAVPNSTFWSITLPPLPTPLRWDTSSLYTTGTLTILPEPTTLLAVAVPFLIRRRHRATH